MMLAVEVGLDMHRHRAILYDLGKAHFQSGERETDHHAINRLLCVRVNAVYLVVRVRSYK